MAFTSPLQSFNAHPYQTGKILALDMAAHAAIGALAGPIVALSPFIGTTFAMLYFAGSTAAHFLEGWLEQNVRGGFGDQSTFTKTLKFALAFIAGIVTAGLGCSALGLPVIAFAGTTLTIAMFATTAAIGMFVYEHAFARDVILGPSMYSSCFS